MATGKTEIEDMIEQVRIEERKRIGEWLGKEYIVGTITIFEAIIALKHGKLPTGA